ncbi:MAG: leucine-rich repeat protein [Clostridia bacterium]|nr:leucine-rich repeat protein [Clostridia bacterium]
MKRKALLTILFAATFCLLFVFGICAATTNEFADTPETIDGIDLTNMNTDTTSRVVIVDANGEYHTYPAQYVVSNNTKFYYNFSPINTALGTSYNKHSVIRIEVPDNILIATNCGDLSQTNNLVEIKFSPSSQLHTLEYGCFYANKKLEKLNIPKNVTTMGTLIINNSSALKELIFDDGFCAIPPKDSFTGAKNIQKVVFSNQMTTIDRKAFFNSFTSVKEIYLGASLMDLGAAAKVDSGGTDGGNFSYTDGPLKIYASENLFANIDTIERGRLNGWTGNRLLKGVVFYTGTMAQAQALVDKAESDTPIFNNATLVEWDSTKTDDEYVPSSGWTIVCNYNKCRAFYGNQHDEQKLNSCQFGCARGCGVVALLENPEHSFGKTVSYGGKSDVNYYLPITVCEACENCKTAKGDVVEIDPLFTDKGYSVCLDDVGITYKFSADLEAIKLYKQHVSSDFEYGVVASKNEGAPLSVVNGKAESLANTVNVAMQATELGYFEIKVIGLSDEYLDTPIVCCGYVRENEAIYYLSEGLSSVSATGKTYNSFN